MGHLMEFQGYWDNKKLGYVKSLCSRFLGLVCCRFCFMLCMVLLLLFPSLRLPSDLFLVSVLCGVHNLTWHEWAELEFELTQDTYLIHETFWNNKGYAIAVLTGLQGGRSDYVASHGVRVDERPLEIRVGVGSIAFYNGDGFCRFCLRLLLAWHVEIFNTFFVF